MKNQFLLEACKCSSPVSWGWGVGAETHRCWVIPELSQQRSPQQVTTVQQLCCQLSCECDGERPYTDTMWISSSFSWNWHSSTSSAEAITAWRHSVSVKTRRRSKRWPRQRFHFKPWMKWISSQFKTRSHCLTAQTWKEILSRLEQHFIPILYSITQRFICSLWSSWRVLHYQQGPSWAHVDRFWPSRSLVWSLILEDAFRRPMSAALSWDWPVTSPPVKCAFSFFIDLRWGQVLLMFKEISNVTGCCGMSPSFMSSVKHPQKAKVLSSSPTGEEAQCDCVCPSGSTSFLSRIIRLLVFVDTTLWRNIGNVFAIEWIFIAI